MEPSGASDWSLARQMCENSELKCEGSVSDVFHVRGKNYLEETVCSDKACNCHCICGCSFISGRYRRSLCKRGKPCPQSQETCFCACCEIVSGLFRPQLKQTRLCWDRAEQRAFMVSPELLRCVFAWCVHLLSSGSRTCRSQKPDLNIYLILQRQADPVTPFCPLTSPVYVRTRNVKNLVLRISVKCSSLHVIFAVRCFEFWEGSWVLLGWWWC